MENTEEIEQLIKKLVLQNAVRHNGKAKIDPVVGSLLALRPNLKAFVKNITAMAVTVVKELNTLSLIEQKKLVGEYWPELLVEKKGKLEKRILPPLENIEKYPFIHLRFCPNPDGALHLGGARALILNDEYRKMYAGRLTLRFDDSDPRTKSPIPEAYDWIREDLRWLEVEWQSEVYQSDRLELYYSYAVKLLDMGVAYVCTCKSEDYRVKILASKACPCRGLNPEENLTRWNYMLDGKYLEGDAVVRIKTDLEHPNPAVRDWPALRIIDTRKYPHARTGDKYRVWPLFAYCCGIDDHDLQISHILRGKEHLTNSVRQDFLYSYLGWEYPEAIHYGRLKIFGTVLSKSMIRKSVEEGNFSGWDDPRLGTLKALKRRGYSPMTIRRLMIEIGPKPVDVTISWENLDAINRKILDSKANRYFFINDPVDLIVIGLEKKLISKQLLHPNYPERGNRTFKIVPEKKAFTFLVSKNDLDILRSNKVVRLMGLFNIEIESVGGKVEAQYHSKNYLKARRLGVPMIHWLPSKTGIQTQIIMPNASASNGLAEDLCRDLNKDDVVQFERFGFVRIDKIDEKITGYYAHR